MAFMSEARLRLGGGNAPSMQHSHQQQKKSHKKKVPLPPQPREGGGEHRRGVRRSRGSGVDRRGGGGAQAGGGAYEVMGADESDDGSGQVYRIPEDLIIAMPRSALCRAESKLPSGHRRARGVSHDDHVLPRGRGAEREEAGRRVRGLSPGV